MGRTHIEMLIKQQATRSTIFKDRVALEREVLTLINTTLKGAPTLTGLTRKTINRWQSECPYDISMICSELLSISSLLGSMCDNSRTVFEIAGRKSVRSDVKERIKELGTLLKKN